jgi:ankyrin repeat protein
MTPLHWLAFNEDIITAKYLLDNKAKHQFNDNKNSPVDIAGFSRVP